MTTPGTITGTAAAAGGCDPALNPKLKPAAHEFEACLMKEFLEPLQKDPLSNDDGDSDSNEGSSSALMSFGSEALARAISERGGFGIATKIIEHFQAGGGSEGKSGEAVDSRIFGRRI